MTDRFATENNFQGDLSKEFFSLVSLFQLSMHLRTHHQIDVRNTHVAEYLWLYSLIQSTCPGVTREKYIGVITNI